MKKATPILVPITLILTASFSLLHLPRTHLLHNYSPLRTHARDVIASYAQWHAQQRRCLNSSTCSPPLLVWQCPQHNAEKCAGLGDRMRGVQFALMFAILTQRVLLLDWPADPFEIQTVLQPAVIDWTVPFKRMRTDLILDWYACNEGNICRNGTNGRFPSLQYLPVTTAKRKERLRDMNLFEHDAQQRLRSFKRVSITQRFYWRTTARLLQAYNSRHGLSLFAGISELQLQRALAKALFQPSEAVKQRMNAFGLQHTKYAAVHIRTGGDFKEVDNRFKKLLKNEAKAARRVVQTLRDTLQQHQNVFSNVMYVASDSLRLKKRLRRAAKRHGIRVVSCEGQALHIAKIGLKHEKVASEQQLRRMFVEVFVDLFMLSRGSALLSSGSGFSDAAWMLGNDQQLVRLAL